MSATDVVHFKYPRLMQRVETVEAAMRGKKYVPLFHAYSASLRPVRIFLETMAKPQNYFRYLRMPSAALMVSRQELLKKFAARDQLPDNRSAVDGYDDRMDQHPAIRPHLLSASYSLSEKRPMESASDFLTRNDSVAQPTELAPVFSHTVWNLLRQHGKADRHTFVMQRLEDLGRQFRQHQMGSLLAVGLPADRADRYAYDSAPYGFPTGNPLGSGSQARLMLYDETLRSDSGLQVVDVTDEDEVGRYTGQPQAPSPSQEERDSDEMRRHLDAQARSVV